MQKNLLRVLIAAAALIPSASAGVVYSIVPIGPAPAAGSNGDVLEVLLSNTGVSAISVAAFNFGVTTTDTDVTFVSADTATTSQPYIFFGNSFDVQNSLPLNTTSGPSLLGSDLTADFITNVSLAGGQSLALGRVLYNVALNAALGPFIVDFTTGAFDNKLSQADLTDVPINTLQGATITIGAAVPEPATLLLIPAGLLALAWRKRAVQRARA
jgi:hypothetical protein